MDALTDFWIFELLGRLHPLVVHFPIALLVVAAFLEALTRGGRRPELRDGIRWLVGIGAATAVLAVTKGWLLARNGGYGGDTLTYHQWLGVATAALALVTALLLRRADRTGRTRARTAYRTALGLCLVVLTVAGHLGAMLTHGEDYLTSVLPWNQVDSKADELLAEFRTVSDGALSETQLDRLNLEVRAVFAHRCYRCHSTEKHEGDLILDTREGVMSGGESGPILVAGDAARSELVRRITLPSGHEEAMPEKGEPLTPDEIELIELWIDRGAHWADRELKLFPEAELALDMPPLPPARDGIDHPVDRLVDATFREHDIAWPEPVNDRTFLRRASLDIVGLLPTPEQIEAFEADDAPDKRERLVRELLDETHDYAQHWLTFWNDLLRNDYSGTGYITGGRQQITDWLYDALASNRSYDQMVRELLDPAPGSEGFIRGIQWRGAANNSQRTEMQAAQNISQSLLGVNLKCASCHNSFVSNLTLDQAYGFANVFADTVLEVFRCDKPTGRMAQTAFLYPELGTIDAETVDERLAQLADVVVQPANGRLYRTVANRFWDRLTGRGIVMPVDEMDNPPWSQDLLDWLAADLIAHDTDLKHLITRIMTSRAYQLPSVPVDDPRDLLAESYTFRGPVRRRLSAEQFADALSQTLGPVYHSVAFDPLGEDIAADWIWHREREVDRDVLPKPGARYFRHTFDVEGGAEPVEAQALVSVDHAFTLYVNGVRAAQGSDWREVQRLDLREHLRPGVNLLAVEGENEGPLPNPAGILFDLRLTYADGRRQHVVSNTDWKTTAETPGDGWTDPGFDDGAWESARRYGRFERSHWGRLLDFRHDPEAPRLPTARASLVTLDPFLKALGRPNRENVVTRRDDQATLLQALELTNGEFFNTAVREGAERWLRTHGEDPDALIDALYRRALGRAPTRQELRTATDVLGDPPARDGVEDLLWSIFLLPEFQLIY